MILKTLLRRLFGSRNERNIRDCRRIVAKINELEEDTRALSDSELSGRTELFKARLQEGQSLEQLLPEAFATVREASRRVLGMRHFDVQLIGGIVLHRGNVAEMATGEGKTLVATLPLYLNALTGKGAHLVTVNDYLAERDAKWMGPIYRFLGLEVGVALSMQEQQLRRQAYQADITYGTNNEFGFDYLRDNMVFASDDRVQRELCYAIVDEVDSILIDEARTPLIISGLAEGGPQLYRDIDKVIPQLHRAADESGEDGDYTVDEKQRQVELTERGHETVEHWLSGEGLLAAGETLYDAQKLNLLHHVQSALRAHHLYRRDVEYMVQDDEILLIDEHTGRTMPNRRLSEGLHQALEAKEGLTVQPESQTLASTTFQNFFRLYDKLAGMTGTADTEAAEFHQIYNLEVIVVPTNAEIRRSDLDDLIYLSAEEKFGAVAKDIEIYVAKGAPILIGTTSIENSERLSLELSKVNIRHEVLNAKQHRREATIIAQAGRPKAVTIATNMAGRGTDIVLGGNVEAEIAAAEDLSDSDAQRLREDWQQRHEQVIAAGGLHVLGTERHESRRIDNQLRGRSGRQGDPGLSRFYLSLDDNLLRIFLSDRVKRFMRGLGLEHGESIEHRMATRSIEKAQYRVEARNFEIRKQLLEYDNIADIQRKVIYGQRRELLAADDISENIIELRQSVIDEVLNEFVPPNALPEQWDIPGLSTAVERYFAQPLPLSEWLEQDQELARDGLAKRIDTEAANAYLTKVEELGEEMRRVEKFIMLEVLDSLWKKHLAAMDHLRQGIHFRAYAQRNPKQEYKREAFHMFQALLDQIRHEFIRRLFSFQVERVAEVEAEEQRRREEERQRRQSSASGDAAGPRRAGGGRRRAPSAAAAGRSAAQKSARKVGRNDPCPCGSGKKYKLCHGR